MLGFEFQTMLGFEFQTQFKPRMSRMSKSSSSNNVSPNCNHNLHAHYRMSKHHTTYYFNVISNCNQNIQNEYIYSHKITLERRSIMMMKLYNPFSRFLSMGDTTSHLETHGMEISPTNHLLGDNNLLQDTENVK